MKNLLMVLAVGAMFLGLLALASPAKAQPMYDDPQVCLGLRGDSDLHLLRVDPTTDPIDVWLKVSSNVVVDYNVADCGGDPSLPVVDSSQVSVGGGKSQVEVRVQTAPKAKVVFHLDDRVKIEKADKRGWVEVQGKLK